MSVLRREDMHDGRFLGSCLLHFQRTVELEAQRHEK